MKKLIVLLLVFASLSTFAQQCDSVGFYRNKYDSIYAKHIVVKFQLERIKYYTGICNRNPKKTVFLRGWINRVINK